MQNADGARLTARREALGITRADLARILGVTESCIWRWEKGHRRVPKWIDVVLDTLEQDEGKMVSSLAWLNRMRSTPGA